jgi:hypothetical protein
MQETQKDIGAATALRERFFAEGIIQACGGGGKKKSAETIRFL